MRLFIKLIRGDGKVCLEQKKLQEGQLGVSLVFSPHFDVICELLLNKRRASWDLFISC